MTASILQTGAPAPADRARRSGRRRLLATVLGAGLGLGLLLGAFAPAASPASAHDRLVSSTPGEGENSAEAPTEARLTFSGKLMELGALVRVEDAAGVDWAQGDPVTEDTVVSTAFRDGMPEGSYQILWRVVSSDGHPIEGVVPFSVGDPAAAPQPAPAETTAVPQETSAAPSPSASPESTQAAETPGALEPGSPLRLVLIGGIGAAVAAIAAGVWFVLRRRRS